MPGFEEWESFYVIVGTAAAALIGLQFVVLTLIADRPQMATREGGAAFASPTVVHFSAVLLLSAVLRVPWEEFAHAIVLWGLIGFAGVIYQVVVSRRMRRQSTYRPDFEDWLFHAGLPFVAYAILLGAAFIAPSHEHEALLAVAASVLALLFLSIHNVWDMISYQVFVRMRKDGD
jgi:hypothetical protein